jgi:hypothetical protein
MTRQDSIGLRSTPRPSTPALTRSLSEGSRDVLAGAPSYAELSRSPMLLREPLAGTTVYTFPGTLGHLPAWFPQFS